MTHSSSRPHPAGCRDDEPRPAGALPELTRLAIGSDSGFPAPQPVTVGLPFAKASLTGPPALCLSGPNNPAVPVQAEALARWSDGSVKWLLLDFVLPATRQGRATWTLGRRNAATNRPAATVRAQETPGEVVIDTGAAVFHLGRTIFGPFARVRAGGRDVLDSSRVSLTGPTGGACVPRVERVEVESPGPVRATVRLEGRFTGAVPCRFVARVCFFAGTALARVRLTVRNPRAARHPGGLWDLGDRNSLFFRDLTVELTLAGRGSVAWSAEPGQPVRTGEAAVEVYQDSSGGESWRSRNHVNLAGRVPCSFRGYRVRTPAGEESGLRASPVVAAGGVAAAVAEFWQQFPKAIESDGRSLRLRLFPGQFEDLFELQPGEQKTHTVWCDFASPGPDSLAWAHRPVHVHAEPGWYAASGALPQFAPAPAGSAVDRYLEPLMAEVVGGARSYFAGREAIDEYGWRNFGEVYADHEEAYCTGPKPVISHYNNQYDIVNGTLCQYLRTGDPRWLDLAGPLARHVIDVDVYHTTGDKAAYNGGLFWFTDHYKDAATSTHRTWSRHNCKPGDRSYGGGPGSCHNFTTGLLHYHYLTGDPLAREAVLSLADWVVNMDDGRQNVLGLLDPGPTGAASDTGYGGYHGPGRGGGLSANALLDGWLLSGRRAYLDKAEELIRRCVHPADDIAGRNLLDVEARWSYTIFFSVLARYLDLKAEAGEVDAAYAYARASLLAYAAWMAEHEIPYFDQAERLEFPTEVWAAQELRKANVLRLAAAHADEPLRARLVRRGEELADRGWADLYRFESRTNARSLAVVMAEGPRDAYFRTRPVAEAPRPPEGCDFGKPTAFVPQKDRIRAQLKSGLGLARTVLRLANVRNWGPLLRRSFA